MTRTELEGWVRERLAGAPLSLENGVLSALRTVEPTASETMHDALLDAALLRLRTALALGDERAAAAPLLEADALLTYAGEAAAEQSQGAVEALHASAAAALAALLETPSA